MILVDFLGPIGLTILAAFIAEATIGRVWNLLTPPLTRRAAQGTAGAGQVLREARRNWAVLLDYRLVLLAAILPDFVDKPMAFWIAPDLVNSSLRGFGHSLLGVVVATVVIAILFRHRWKVAAGSMAVAFSVHLVLDQMWRKPEVLYWPHRGLDFPEGHVPWSHWFDVHFRHLPVDTLDLIGIAALLAGAMLIIGTGRSSSLIRHGTLTAEADGGSDSGRIG